MPVFRFVGWRDNEAGSHALHFHATINAIDMLEFCKTVLSRVSFDRRLFAKELKKSFQWLSREDAEALRQWAMAQYSPKHAHAIAAAFAAAQGL